VELWAWVEADNEEQYDYLSRHMSSH
jgi:hypothetical protein